MIVTEHKMQLQLCLLNFIIYTYAVSRAEAGKVVCYYGSWASYRWGNGNCDVDNIDPYLCTHIIYTFMGIDPATNKLRHIDSELDINRGKIALFNALHDVNPNLKTMIAIGGWNEGSTSYSNMAASASRRQVFIQSVLEFLVANGFDGFDLDWEYPASNWGAGADKQNYVLLLKELKEAFAPYGFLLSAAVAAGTYTIQTAYDVPSMSKHVDFINLMAYDYHGGWEANTGHNAPLYPRPEETGEQALLNVNSTVQLWLSLGAPPEKLILGVGTYGITFTLENANNHGYGASVTGPGAPGPYTAEAGIISYHEILARLSTGTWTVVKNQFNQVPYAHSANQWIGYDDEESIRTKMRFAKSLGLGGGMVWTIENDDFLGTYGKAFPLISIIKEEFGSGSSGPEPPAPTGSTNTPTTTTQAPTTSTTSMATTTTKTPTTPTTSESGTLDVLAYILSRCPYQTYIRHPQDCSKFYTCTFATNKYTTHEFQCQADLNFDTTVNVCNWWFLVTC